MVRHRRSARLLYQHSQDERSRRRVDVRTTLDGDECSQQVSCVAVRMSIYSHCKIGTESAYVDFYQYGMNPERQPSSCSERDSQRCCDLDWVLAVEVRRDDYALPGVGTIVVCDAIWVVAQCTLLTEREVYLGAGVGGGD
jgi:hypothetical protein